MRVLSRPLFFLFLALGPFVVIPYLMLYPIRVTFSAAWRRSRSWLWRVLIAASVLLAILITCPGSPLFQGLETPIPIGDIPPFYGIDFAIDETVAGPSGDADQCRFRCLGDFDLNKKKDHPKVAFLEMN